MIRGTARQWEAARAQVGNAEPGGLEEGQRELRGPQWN